MKLSLPTRIPGSRRPLVEVVVPCHNYARYLPACIASTQQQSDIDVAVTIVDDASSDDSVQVAERLGASHPRIKLIRNPTNLGMAGTFNHGLKQADSDYVLLLSADDMVAPGALTRAAALMEANPGVGLVYGRTQKFATEPSLRRPMPAESWTTWTGREWIDLQFSRGWSNISSPEAVVRTEVQHAAGYYDPELRHTLDVEMWLRIAALADVGHINGVDQAYYRRHPGNHSAQFSAVDSVEERWRAYDQFLRNWSQAGQAPALRAKVGRRLADELLFGVLVSLEHEQADDDLVDRALAVAARIDPGADERGLWSDVQARRAGGRPGDPAALARAAVRSAAYRTSWYRWYKFRYLG